MSNDFDVELWATYLRIALDSTAGSSDSPSNIVDKANEIAKIAERLERETRLASRG
jgi:hypothetical protein